jgi:hypothetical protein
MRNNQTNLHSVLAKHGVSPLEYAAMTCPYYDIPLAPREMASWTVLECWKGPDADGEDDYSADQYLEAMFDLIKKGWLCIQQTASPVNQVASAWLPQRDAFPPSVGAVVFTKAGYLLHRHILRDLHGTKFVQRVDSFTTIDRKQRVVHFYAASLPLCHDWIHDIQQVTSSNSISSLLGVPAEIRAIEGPERIGKWQPSRFLTLPRGYRVVVQYRRRNIQTFREPELELEARIQNRTPISILGSIHGLPFFFHDLPAWTSPRCDDASAVFQWKFSIEGAPQHQVPPKAVVSGEQAAAGSYIIPQSMFSCEEQDGYQRRAMLSAKEAKQLLIACARQYRSQRQSAALRSQ